MEIRAFQLKIEHKTTALSIARDISKRKGVEKAFRESEEKCRLLVENANEGIVVVWDG